MKVALYARVATQDPDDRDGIVSQVEALRAHAARQLHEVVEDYVCCDAGYSGASLDRPGLHRLRDGVQASAFDAVLILSPDRLSRKWADFIRMLKEFERFATSVEFVEQPLLQLDSENMCGDDETDACPLEFDPLPHHEGVKPEIKCRTRISCFGP